MVSFFTWEKHTCKVVGLLSSCSITLERECEIVIEKFGLGT